jgi:uncharacterized protein (TIRG00374 family)
LLIVQSREITFFETLKTVFAGNFASNFLPSTIGGDTVRIISAARSVGWSVSMASVVVDRVINVFAMICFLLGFVNSYTPISLDLGFGSWILSGNKSLLVLGGTLPFYRRIVDTFKNLVKKIVKALRIWQNQPVSIIGAFLVSILSRTVVFLGVWLLARGMGMGVTLSQVIIIGAITYFLSLLPVSINGLGLREVTMTTLYVQQGASIEQASALVLVTRFMLLIETLPGVAWISDKLVNNNDGK